MRPSRSAAAARRVPSLSAWVLTLVLASAALAAEPVVPGATPAPDLAYTRSALSGFYRDADGRGLAITREGAALVLWFGDRRARVTPEGDDRWRVDWGGGVAAQVLRVPDGELGLAIEFDGRAYRRLRNPPVGRLSLR